MGNFSLSLKRSLGMLLACFLCYGVLWAAPLRAQVADIRIADSKGDWGYPNPYRHYPRGPGFIRMSWVFETLVWKDDQGYIPALAKSWAYDPDRTAFVFQLQDGVTWHDGEPFTADDVVFTVNYFKKRYCRSFWCCSCRGGVNPLPRAGVKPAPTLELAPTVSRTHRFDCY
jgi:peptide/nickel transport system substrate-binding protein